MDSENADYDIVTSDDTVAAGTAYYITGELPEELAGLEYTEDADGRFVYENVPDEIMALLLISVEGIKEESSDITGNIVKWIP